MKHQPVPTSFTGHRPAAQRQYYRTSRGVLRRVRIFFGLLLCPPLRTVVSPGCCVVPEIRFDVVVLGSPGYLSGASLQAKQDCT